MEICLDFFPAYNIERLLIGDFGSFHLIWVIDVEDVLERQLLSCSFILLILIKDFRKFVGRGKSHFLLRKVLLARVLRELNGQLVDFR